MPEDTTRLELPVELADRIRRELVEHFDAPPSALLLTDQKISAAFSVAVKYLCKEGHEVLKDKVHKFIDEQTRAAVVAIAEKLKELGEAALKEKLDASSEELAKEIIGELEKEAGQLDKELDKESVRARVLLEIRKNFGPQALGDALNPASHRELMVSKPIRSWREQDGVIYFSVTSDGTTGSQWIERLEGKSSRVGEYAKQVLCSSDFKPTSGVTTEVAVLKGMLFADDDRITKKIRDEAEGRKLTKLNPEAAGLIREKFTDEEIEAMGLWWVVVMHEPIKDSDGDPHLFSVGRIDGGRWLGAYYDSPGGRWFRESGFAFAVSQV